MRVLLDTHAFLHWVFDPGRLGVNAHRVLSDPDVDVFWSVASSWELAIKSSIGKLDLGAPVASVVASETMRYGFHLLAIEHAHVLAVTDLPRHHGDPFDRLLICQARMEGLALVSADAKLEPYGVTLIW